MPKKPKPLTVQEREELERLRGRIALPELPESMKGRMRKRVAELDRRARRTDPSLSRLEQYDDEELSAESLAGIEDVDFLRGFRDDESLPGSVRLAAQKELSRVLERKDAAAREAEQNKEWTPPGDPSLVAQALIDVLRVQSAETLDAFNTLKAQHVLMPKPTPDPETLTPARKSTKQSQSSSGID